MSLTPHRRVLRLWAAVQMKLLEKGNEVRPCQSDVSRVKVRFVSGVLSDVDRGCFLHDLGNLPQVNRQSRTSHTATLQNAF